MEFLYFLFTQDILHYPGVKRNYKLIRFPYGDKGGDNKEELQNYFNSQDWYVPDSSYNGHLSPVEKANVEFIKSHE